MLEYMGVDVEKSNNDKSALATEILRHRQMQSMAKYASQGSTSKGELTKKLKKDEARLMQRDVEELRALLDYMDVDYDRALDSKERLVALIINQKHLGEATVAVQRIVRRVSSRHETEEPLYTPRGTPVAYLPPLGE